MSNLALSYPNAVAQLGSKRAVRIAVDKGSLFRVYRGVYSSQPFVNPMLVAMQRWPNAVITMDSAFYYYGLTDVFPEQTHLALPRTGARIKDDEYRQYFMRADLLACGVNEVEVDGQPVRMFSKERMLVELLRNHSKLSYSYYRELINAYRDEIYRLNMRTVDECIGLFRKTAKLEEMLEREVL